MRQKIKILIILVILILSSSGIYMSADAASVPSTGSLSALSSNPASSSASNYEKAIDLKVLGLFANKPKNFDLERMPTRAEGTAMLVRLLGKEYEAIHGGYIHPFKDVPAWADAYVGYAYQNGIAMGRKNDIFGADEPLTAKQYVTFVLRSLGYRDNIDFTYDKALEKAMRIGLISASELDSYTNRTSFIRNDLVAVSHNALKMKLNGSSQMLIEKLVDTDKAVFKPAAEKVGLYPSKYQKQYNITSFYPGKTINGYVVKSKEDLIRLLATSIMDRKTELKIDVSNNCNEILQYYRESLNTAIEAAESITGVKDLLKSWDYICGRYSMDVSFEYRYSKSEYETRKARVKAAIDAGRHIVAENISITMAEFEKEKVLHDYIVSNTRYDRENLQNNTLLDEAFEEYGCLVSGVAVCEGYARGMKLLCDLAGIECLVVTGWEAEGSNPDSHAWNIVKIDGKYYHLDTTNDDPVLGNGAEILTYSYFNLTDNEMGKKYVWAREEFPRCNSMESNYYYKFNMLAENREVFDKVLKQELLKRSSVIELKVNDYSERKYSNIKDLIFNTDIVLRYVCIINDDLGVIRIFNIKYSE